MSLRVILSNTAPLIRRQSICLRRCLATETSDTKKTEALVDATAADEIPLYEDEKREKEEIMKKRNKSRLNPSHRNIVLGRKPYEESMAWFHDTVKYKRKMLGRYGMGAVDVPAGFAWPTPEEVEDAKEFERVGYPLSIQEEWKKIKEMREQEQRDREARDREVAEAMAMMDKLKQDLKDKIAKKEAQLNAAKAAKDRLIEEVRRHFGFKISPNDERFKEMLEKKEKEEKKKKKEAKKQARLEKLLGLQLNAEKKIAEEKQDTGKETGEAPSAEEVKKPTESEEVKKPTE